MERLNTGVVNNRFSEMGTFGEGFFTEEEEKNCIGLLLYKPDSVMTSLDLQINSYIQEELEMTTKKHVFLFAHTQICIDDRMAHELYPEEKTQRYLPYIIDNFNSGPSTLVLVMSKNAPEELNKMKGQIRTRTGIRGRFSFDFNVDEEVIKKWRANEFDPSTTKQIGINLYGANIIHIPDDKDDVKRTINLLYPKKDLQDMIGSIPIFSRWYRQ